jgi:hypothetical protein
LTIAAIPVEQWMERLWSLAGATSGNPGKCEQPENGSTGKAVARDRLPPTRHGKEGVDGSRQGLAKARTPGALFRIGLLALERGQIRSPLWSVQVESAVPLAGSDPNWSSATA